MPTWEVPGVLHRCTVTFDSSTEKLGVLYVIGSYCASALINRPRLKLRQGTIGIWLGPTRYGKVRRSWERRYSGCR